MATASGGSISQTNDSLIDGLLQGNVWSFPSGPRVITYSLNQTGYGGSWTQPMSVAVDSAFAAWEAVANIDFQRVTSGTYSWQSSADIAVGLTGSQQSTQWGSIGYADFPNSAENSVDRADLGSLLGQTFTTANYAHPEGDIYLDNYAADYSYLDPGGYGLTVIMHEIGHALGLKHPHDDGGTGFPTFAELGISNLDLDQYTLMSYNFAFPYIDIGNPETPMVLDILAIQYLYGANMAYHTGNDTYRVTYGHIYAIWDAGGFDTIDASSTQGITLDLKAGSTNIDKADYATVGIAFGVTIENAIGSSFNDVISGNAVDNTIRGGAGSDKIFGFEGNDVLYGNAFISDEADSNDYLDGGVGHDIMSGGNGDDTYVVDAIEDIVSEFANAGIDTVISSVGFALATFVNVENVTLTGAAAIDVTGNDSDNIIIGNDGNNVLHGGAGADTFKDSGSSDEDQFIGGTGGDVYYVNSVGEHVVELAGEGIDGIKTTLDSYTLDGNVENLYFLDRNGVTGIGNGLNNYITGSFGNDVLDGGAGEDEYAGSAGSDIYYIDSVYDKIDIEWIFGDIDEVRMSVSDTIASYDGIERFVLLGSDNLSAYGNLLNNTIIGNSGANYLSGWFGNDTIVFGDGDFAAGGEDVDSYTFVANPSVGLRETATITNFEYLETLSFSTVLPLDGAISLDLGDGSSTGLNHLEYFSNGLQTYLSFGLDDVAGADLTITLQNHVKIEDLKVTADGSTITIANMDVPNQAPFDLILWAPTMVISEDTPVGTVLGTLEGLDVDEKGALTYSILEGSFSDFAIADGNKLVLAKPLDSDKGQVYDYADVRVTDSEGAWYDRGFQFQITDANDNAPVITSFGGVPLYSTARGENDLFAVSVTATDVDKTSKLSYSIVGGTDKDLFNIDSIGGVYFKKAPDFELPSDSDHDNVYAFDVAVSDGKFSATQSFLITILDKAGSTLQGGAGADLFDKPRTTDEDDKISGLGGNDTIRTYLGNDLLDGGTGNDALTGGAGNDTYVVDSVGDKILGEDVDGGADTVKSSISWALGTGLEALVLTGAAAVNATGNAAANQLTGNIAANTLDGRGGADAMAGGNGADTYVVDNVGDTVTESTGGSTGGVDLVKSSVSFTLGANIEKLTLTGTGAIDGTGNTLNNILVGNDGNNRLDGGAGNDTMTGYKGNDTYVVDAAGDIVNETVLNSSGGGIDTVESAITFSLLTRTNIENLTLTGGAANATGNALANILTGNTLANTLDGSTGADTMRGGAGNDLYIVDNSGDMVDEQANTDLGDEVKSATIRFSAVAGIENYTYTGALAWNFLGTAAANRISGGSAADTLNGADGNDTILGNAGNDTLIGGIGNDWLDGGTGNDKLKGGAGNDTYVINAAGDTIDEEGNADIADLVRSSVTVNLLTLAQGLIENATLLGTVAVNATGNDGINILTGNDGANVLDGKGGADSLFGGKGADTYVIDNVGDHVTEMVAGAAGGVDLVKSSVSFTLGANLEKLTLTGSGHINGFGNELNNVLIGNDGNNRLDGGAGNDTMTGGKGDDTYVVNAAGDVVNETIAAGGGIDTVESSITFSLATRVNVENLTLTGIGNINGTGNALNNHLIGNTVNNTLDGGSGNDLIEGGDGNDTLLGNLGNDTLIGGLGADKLTGGGGRDTFDYNLLADAGDTITDFAKGATGDVLDLRDILDSVGYAGTDPFADHFLSFTQSGANTIVSIDADGGGIGGATTLATLLNVTLMQSNTDNYLA
jgi:Ca2+-binding RTX toxin-like protein